MAMLATNNDERKMQMTKAKIQFACAICFACSVGTQIADGSAKNPANVRFTDAVYAAFQKQGADFIQNVRPERNQDKKLRAWGRSAQILSRELESISTESVTDAALIKLKTTVQSEAAAVSKLLLAPDAKSNMKVIMKRSELLDKAQEQFDKYVNTKGY
jgi:hypothetical protein